MAADIIMGIGAAVFAALFMVITAIFVTTIISFSKKQEFAKYEPKVSIIVPCCNEEKNISTCLERIFHQDYPQDKVEVFVVDDGSTDNTNNILREYAARYKNLIVINGKHEGKSAALNLGLVHAKNEIIFTVDADTIICKDALRLLAAPFMDPEIGATNGSCIPRNSGNLLCMFQKIEYYYNNLIRKSFSVLFNNSIWFFGAFACFRKSVLENIKGFKQDTIAEDLDVALEICGAGYRVISIDNALGYTFVPAALKGFFNQRIRWWMGVMQALNKNKALFTWRSNPSIIFLYLHQYWWSFYAAVSLPLIIYQVNYWLPYNLGSSYDLFMYLFRWFSFLGPIYVIYKIPEWGISAYSIFGVLSGIFSTFLIIKSIYVYKGHLTFKKLISIFFYFPYTILLNTIIAMSLIKLIFTKKKYFIY